jgi:Ca-activated chloride channel family protein
MNWGASHVLPWLVLLAPAAWLVLALLARRERMLRRLIDPRVLPLLAPARAPGRYRNKHLLWLAALALGALALARPQWGFRWEEVKRRGLDIIVVLDTSRSMLAEDIKPNRLQQAKWGVRDLVGLLKGDRIGLVAFAGSSFLQCPLTIDYAAFLMTLEDLYAGIIPRGGTAIVQALRTAINSFEERDDADRVIILVTDGEDHEGQWSALPQELQDKQIKLFAIGIGTEEGELIPDGAAGFFKDRQGRVVKTALQENVLETLALGTGGMYVRAGAGDFGLKRDEKESRLARINEERFTWLVAAALLLLVMEAAIPERIKPSSVIPT